MKTSTLLKSCLVLALLWLFILGPGLWARVRILRHVAGYHRTEMIVTATNCIGGQTRRDAHGNTTTDPRYCFLDGSIGGTPVSLCTGSTLPAGRGVGSRVKVLYNPTLPAFGVNYENLQVLEDEADLARSTRGQILGALGIIAWTFALTTGVHVWFRWTVGRRGGVTEIPSAQAGLGQALLGVGLAFLVMQVPRPACGGAVFGLLLAVPGAVILGRLYQRAMPHGPKAAA